MKHTAPLSAMKVFEVAARHLSFTRAADELFVTQAAVSHQIRRLEDFLGVKLFKRMNRALMLTDSGQMLLPPVRDALVQIDQAVQRVTAPDHSGRLTVSVLPSVAARWLVPRLGSFLTQHPDIDLLLSPSNKLTNFDQDDVDVVIRYGHGDYPGLVVRWLMDEDRFPVCAPSLQTHGPPLETPADLDRHVLLHDDDRSQWRMWLRLAGAGQVDASHGPVFTDASLMLEAALTGQGVALARRVLAETALKDGQLVRLFKQALPTNQAYYLVYPPTHGERREVQAFCDWALNLPAPDS
ncbi:MAG: transcriptional regulator GcvA [Pseudomonadota bacterium]